MITIELSNNSDEIDDLNRKGEEVLKIIVKDVVQLKREGNMELGKQKVGFTHVLAHNDLGPIPFSI